MPRTTHIRAGLGAAVKAALLALAACTFAPAGGELDAPAVPADAPDGDGAEPDAPAIDAPATDAPAIDAAIDAPPLTPLCDVNDPTQRLCLTFEGSVTDGTGGPLQIQTSNVDFDAGAVGMGSTLGLTSVIHVGENNAIDVTSGLTIEAFVRVTAPPSQTNQRAGVLDNNGQYSLWIDPEGRPYCTLPGSTASTTTPLPLNAWTHVACVFDGATYTLYVGGVEVGQVNRTAPVPANGNDGLNVGQDCTDGGGAADPLRGGIDELRLWSVGRSPAQIAAAAARMP